MQKKLLAAAVASIGVGMWAAPEVALAQSSVTITGNFKISAETVRIRNFTRAGRSSEGRLADDSSRIIFNVTEDLGGGLFAIGQYDIRIKFDDSGATDATPNIGGKLAGGNTFVGLRHKAWGQLTFGRNDLHYFNTESTLTTKAASLRHDSISLLAYVAGSTNAGGGVVTAPVSGGVAIATASRSQNVTRYLSPNWGGFTFIAAYSTNTPGNDSDIGSTIRRGHAWNINPNFQARNFQVGYSYWNSKADGVFAAGAAATPATVTPGASCAGGGAVAVPATGPGGATTVNNTCATTATFTITPGTAAGAAGSGIGQEQRGDRLYGSFRWAGFQVGLAWDKSKLETAAGLTQNRRTAWSFPVSWSGGNHNVYAHFTKARDDKATAVQDGARMWAVAYVYDLSKRTSVGVSYSAIRNDAGAAYNHFTTASLGDAAAGIVAGEDPRILAATIRHAF